MACMLASAANLAEALDTFMPAAPGAAPPPLSPREHVERRRRAAAAVVSRVAARADAPVEAEERVEAGEPSRVIETVAEAPPDEGGSGRPDGRSPRRLLGRFGCD